MNCLPLLGHEKWEAFFMHVDLKVKYDVEAKKVAIELFERDCGFESTAKVLSVPRASANVKTAISTNAD